MDHGVFRLFPSFEVLHFLYYVSPYSKLIKGRYCTGCHIPRQLIIANVNRGKVSTKLCPKFAESYGHGTSYSKYYISEKDHCKWKSFCDPRDNESIHLVGIPHAEYIFTLTVCILFSLPTLKFVPLWSRNVKPTLRREDPQGIQATIICVNSV